MMQTLSEYRATKAKQSYVAAKQAEAKAALELLVWWAELVASDNKQNAK